MKRLNAAREKERRELVEALMERQDDVQQAWDNFAAAHTALVAEIEKYNEVVTELAEFRDGLVDAMNIYADERSEKWEESHSGHEYRNWLNDWEALDCNPLDPPDEPDELEMDHAERLAEIPGEPE